MENTIFNNKRASILKACETMMNDLQFIDREIRWVYNDGFWPNGPTIPFMAVRSGSAGFDKTDPNGPDNVRASTFDSGQGGNFKSREAFTTAVMNLSYAEVRTAYAFKLLGVGEQPKLVHPNRQPAKLNVTLSCIKHLYTRLYMLTGEAVSDNLRTPFVYEAERQLNGSAYPCVLRDGTRVIRPNSVSAVSQAKWALQKATSAGKVIPMPDIKKCRICKVRALTRVSVGGRCPTCTQHFYRHGSERPTHLDGGYDPIQEAKDAQERRYNAGLGYGEA